MTRPADFGDATTTGLATLDTILGGGYAASRSHLIEGRPGSGKTTLALQFLTAGSAIGERGLYITLSESRSELIYVAKTHGMDISGIEICELFPPELSLDADMQQSVVYASDLELSETVQLVIAATKAGNPRRVVFDSLSEIELLAQSPLGYRRQVLALKHFFALQGCTVIFLNDVTEASDSVNLHSLVHGVIRLEQTTIAYGAERRRLRVFKMRARNFIGGFHDYKIKQGGLQIFPRLIAADQRQEAPVGGMVGSGVAELDRMIGGGLDRGTSTLIAGPSGAGKSTLAMQFLQSMLRQGEKALFISFDETERNFRLRNTGLGIALDAATAEGRFRFLPINPAELTPGEVAETIREHVEDGFTGVVIDSLTGYQQAMPEEKFLLLQLHELVTFLNERNVLTILVLTQSSFMGQMHSPFDLTYLADGVLLMRFYEATGKVHRAISVLKRRTGPHDNLIREFSIGPGGIAIGAVPQALTGVLSGSPVPAAGDTAPEPGEA